MFFHTSPSPLAQTRREPGVLGMSLGLQMLVISLMAVFLITMLDYFYLMMVRNELSRNAKSAAMYGLSRGRDFRLAQEDIAHGFWTTADGIDYLNTSKVQTEVENYVNEVIIPQVCQNGQRCYVHNPITVITNPKYINPAHGAKQSNFVSDLPVDAFPPFAGGPYYLESYQPAVGVYMKVTVYIPHFLFGDTELDIYGEAVMDTYQADAPDQGDLPWE